MESKHTPGPLTAHPYNEHIEYVGPGSDIVKRAKNGFCVPVGIAFTPEDARLWAAAPELLEGCKLALRELQAPGLAYDHPDCEGLRAAIAKAKGE